MLGSSLGQLEAKAEVSAFVEAENWIHAQRFEVVLVESATAPPRLDQQDHLGHGDISAALGRSRCGRIKLCVRTSLPFEGRVHDDRSTYRQVLIRLAHKV